MTGTGQSSLFVFLLGFRFAVRRTRSGRLIKTSNKANKCLGVTFKYHKLRKFLSNMPFWFRETWNVDFVSRQLRKNQFIFLWNVILIPHLPSRPLPSSIQFLNELIFLKIITIFAFEPLSLILCAVTVSLKLRLFMIRLVFSLISRRQRSFRPLCHKIQKTIKYTCIARIIMTIESQYCLASFKVTMFGNHFSLSILCDGRIANLQISGSHQSKYESTDLLLKIAVL